MSEEVKLNRKEQYAAQKKDKAIAVKEKRRQLASMMSGGSEPSINPLDYKNSLIIAFNWYNINADYKKYREWLNNYLISTNRKKTVTIVNKVSDYDIKSIGVLSRLKLRDEFLEDNEFNYIETKLDELISSVVTVNKVEPVVPKVVVDKVREESIRLSEGFEEAIDAFVVKKKSTFNATEYLKANQVPASVSKRIGEYYSILLNELKEAFEGKDEQLAEGYSNFTKAQLKKFVAFVESLVVACNQQVVSSKVKKPRVKKAVPPEKLISKLNYLKEFQELGLKSVKPTSVVESNEIWLYNTKNKRLFVYKSAEGNKLSVRGTVITGYDIKESVSVCLKKPDEFFKNTSLAKRALATAFKTVTTKQIPANGRVCDTMIILGAF